MAFSSLSSLDAVRLRRLIPQDRKFVWEQLSNQRNRKHWWPDAAITCALGGQVQAHRQFGQGASVFVGQVDVLVDGHALGFLWAEQGSHPQTSVLITLSSAMRGTEIDVVEVGFAAFDSNAERISQAEQEWTDLLQKLAERSA